MDIGNRLREERERLGMTQEAFGHAGGVLKRALIRYEMGERVPDAAFLAGVASAGADVLYILTGQRNSAAPAESALSKGDRVLLDNFHAAPEQVQAGVKTTLGAFAPKASKQKKVG